MDQKAQEKSARQKLLESIIEAGNKAFNPEQPESLRGQATRDFDDLIQRQAQPSDRYFRTKTLNILGALNVLVRQGAVPEWLRARLMEKLTLVPLRPDGVRATLEFVFSVHPSSTVKVSEAAVPQKRGANITHEALGIASNLLSTPPTKVTPETWYSIIAPQLLVLLDGGEGQELVKAASYIIGFGILGRKASGAPGTAGWKFLAEPMLNTIKPPPGFSNEAGSGADEVIDMSRERVLIPPSDLTTALRRLHSLIISHPNPGLCKRLLSPLLFPLWALGSWPDASPSATGEICTPAMKLLEIYLRLTPSPGLILLLAQNLGYLGGHDRSNPEWIYNATKDGQLQIVDTRECMGSRGGGAPLVKLEDIDTKTPRLVDLITFTLSDADISTAFLDLLKRWLKSARSQKGGNILVKEDDEQDPITQLAEIKVLQAMMEKFPEKLATQPKHILDLVSQILSTSTDSPSADDEVTSVALSLLNMVVTVPGFQKSRVDPSILALIESSLAHLSKSLTPHLSLTANNLRLLLLYRDEIDPTIPPSFYSHHSPNRRSQNSLPCDILHHSPRLPRGGGLGEVPDFSEDVTEEERRRNEVLERIVEGWEIEREVEKGILRRAAVLFVLSFVRALEEARGREELGFGFGRKAQEDVMRTLRYVAETDNDGLVVQHARDVVESLENWQVVRLLPAEGNQQPVLGGGLTRLVGLEIDSERSVAAQGDVKSRPRIEEIE
ncbi:hypothetical protein N0V88_000449 [Collariella sp. IMI 366227]|nr:hypothetical protein N0V88_000449 [Collariella sp. IMI 366227]